MAYFQFLGTGPSTPITDATGHNYRRRTSALVQHISTYVLIDATHDLEEQVEHALSVTHVVITNATRDAAGGLGNLDKWPAVHVFGAIQGQYVPADQIRALDPRVVAQLRQTQASVAEYAQLESRKLGIQVAFALMFAVIT